MPNAAKFEHLDESPEAALGRIASATHCASLLQIWRESRVGTESIPTRSDLDPIVLAKAGLLPFVWILEQDDAGDLFYRLMGEGIRKYFAAQTRGRYLHEVYEGEMLDLVRARCRRVLDERLVMFASGTVYRDSSPLYYARRLLMPLSDDDGGARFLIGTVDQSDPSPDQDVTGSPQFTNDSLAFLRAADL